ncbi:MAG: PEP-CTERM sorting domain-containing protein [Rubrivivax sp.]|nr:MAG: PEP-CTERM sorting domain-containing protein [Rubrivivax sp.]
MTSLALGANKSGTPPAPGLRFSTARATAILADSMSFREGSDSYLWDAGEKFHFNFGVDGSTSLPAGTPTPVDGNGMTWATLRLNLWRPGGLEANNQLSIFDYGAYETRFGADAAWAEYVRLSDVVNGLAMGAAGWCLGDNSTSAGFCGGVFYKQVDLVGGAASVNYSFAPGGDFEWTLELSTQVSLDLSRENTAAVLDFSHTVHAGFTAPVGATTYSASGLLPGTLALAPVPEPETWALMLVGLVGVVSFGRSRARRQA